MRAASSSCLTPKPQGSPFRACRGATQPVTPSRPVCPSQREAKNIPLKGSLVQTPNQPVQWWPCLGPSRMCGCSPHPDPYVLLAFGLLTSGWRCLCLGRLVPSVPPPVLAVPAGPPRAKNVVRASIVGSGLRGRGGTGGEGGVLRDPQRWSRVCECWAGSQGEGSCQVGAKVGRIPGSEPG